MRKNPDITNQRFGYLTVRGLGDRVKDKRGKTVQLWILECDCGKKIQRCRHVVDYGRMTSCGCKKYERTGRKPKDISGQRFGSLIADCLTGKRDKMNKPTWLMRCDCGGSIEMSSSRLGLGYNLRCDSEAHRSEKWLRYPPTPNPYPEEAGRLAEKYLFLTRLHYDRVDSAVEDEKRDRLIRACWILTYRRQQGEEITQLYEKRFIRKHLAFCGIDVFWKRKLELHGGLLYTVYGKRKKIKRGSAVTNATLRNYPVSESGTLGNNLLSTPPKRIKFRRC